MELGEAHDATTRLLSHFFNHEVPTISEWFTSSRAICTTKKIEESAMFNVFSASRTGLDRCLVVLSLATFLTGCQTPEERAQGYYEQAWR